MDFLIGARRITKLQFRSRIIYGTAHYLKLGQISEISIQFKSKSAQCDLMVSMQWDIGDPRENAKQEFISQLTVKLMDVIIMTRFQNEPFSNYDATAFVKDHFGLKISSGTIHSTIYSMERKNLVTGISMDRKRVYRLTEKGKLTVEVATSPEEMTAFMKNLMQKPNGPKQLKSS
jgi:DNA-binding PadR family transcriptional regulator